MFSINLNDNKEDERNWKENLEDHECKINFLRKMYLVLAITLEFILI
jgi:hypothetical protein